MTASHSGIAHRAHAGTTTGQDCGGHGHPLCWAEVFIYIYLHFCLRTNLCHTRKIAKCKQAFNLLTAGLTLCLSFFSVETPDPKVMVSGSRHIDHLFTYFMYM